MKKITILFLLIALAITLSSCQLDNKSFASIAGEITSSKSTSFSVTDSAKPNRDDIVVSSNYVTLSNIDNTYGSATIPLENNEFKFDSVVPGSYILKVWGVNKAGVEIVNYIKELVIKEGENRTLFANLDYIGGRGSFNFNLDLPLSSEVDNILLTSINCPNLNTTIEGKELNGYKNFSFSTDDILTGSYTLKVVYRKGDNHIFTQANGAIVRIYNALTSYYGGFDYDNHNQIEAEFYFVDKNGDLTSRNGTLGNELLETDKIVIKDKKDNNNSTVHYSLDNGNTFSQYTTPLEISSFNIIAYVKKEGYNNSERIYLNDLKVKLAPPIISQVLDALSYEDAITFTKEEGYNYSYTIKDSIPLDSDILSKAKTSSIMIREPGTLYLRSEKEGYISSSWSEMSYEIMLAKFDYAILENEKLSVGYNSKDINNEILAEVYYTTTSNLEERKLDESGIITDYLEGDEVNVFVKKTAWLDSLKTKAISIPTNSSSLYIENNNVEISQSSIILENDSTFSFAILDGNNKLAPSSISMNTYDENGNVVDITSPYTISDDKTHLITVKVNKNERVEKFTLKIRKNSSNPVVINFKSIADLKYWDGTSYHDATRYELNNTIEKSSITKVELFNTFTQINNNEFALINAEITVPNTVNSIGLNAFEPTSIIIYNSTAQAWLSAITQGYSAASESQRIESIVKMPVPNLLSGEVYKVQIQHNSNVLKAEFVEKGSTIELPVLPVMPAKFEREAAWVFGGSEFTSSSVINSNTVVSSGYLVISGLNLNIKNEEDLNLFAASVNDGNSYQGKEINVNITEDISTWPSIGTDSNKFAGTINVLDGSFEQRPKANQGVVINFKVASTKPVNTPQSHKNKDISFVANSAGVFIMQYEIKDVGPAGGRIFLVNSNGTYLEASSTLISGDHRYRDAVEAAENYAYNGYGDWRIPNEIELRSMLNINDLVNFADNYYWSGTIVSGVTGYRVINLKTKDEAFKDKNIVWHKYPVHPCRSFSSTITF